MRIAVLLSVELTEASPWQTVQFHERMLYRGWQPIAGTRTTYHAEFEGAREESQLLHVVRRELADAIEEAAISEWDGVCCLDPLDAAAKPQRVGQLDRRLREIRARERLES